MLVLTLSLYCVDLTKDHRVNFIQFGPRICLTLVSRGLDCRIVFFDDPSLGPYQGSIVSLGDGQETKTTAFGDTWGIYYRKFQRTDGTWSTLSVSLLYALIGSAILPASDILRRLISKPKRKPQNKGLQTKAAIERLDLRKVS